VIARERRRDAHDQDVTHALMTAVMSRTKEPVTVARKLYIRKPQRRPQTTAEGRAIVTLLAAHFGWKARPHQAHVVE